MVHLVSQAEADLVAFEERVRGWPLVRECWMLSGEVDFILKCVAPDLATFQASSPGSPELNAHVKTALRPPQRTSRGSHGAVDSAGMNGIELTLAPLTR
jgi:DNA-binding Lrp family transcriptional regulator